MRVCFYSIETEWSGRPRAFRDGARALAANGYEVSAVCARGSEAERQFLSIGVTPVAAPATGNWIVQAWRLSRALRRNFSEVVFVHSELEHLHAAAAVRFAGRGAVVRRIPPLARLTTGRDARLAVRLSPSGYLFASDADLRAATPPARALGAAVAPLAAQEEGAARGSVPGQRSIVCTYDREHSARAGVVLRTIAMLAARHPEIRLTMFGAPDSNESLRVQAAALGIGRLVAFAGASADSPVLMTQAELSWVLADGDAAAFAFLDAFSAGVPSYAERTPISARYVEDGASGQLTGILDAAGNAAMLAALMADPARFERLADGATTAKKRWSGAPVAEGFIEAATAARDRKRWGV